MGILADFFVSTQADALLYEQFLGDPPADRYEIVDSGRLTSIEIGTLWAILDGVEWNVEQHQLIEHTAMTEESESWLSEFPSQLVTSLATITDDRAAESAKQWSETEEMVGVVSDDLCEFIIELRTLAQHAQATGNGLYLWNSL